MTENQMTFHYFVVTYQFNIFLHFYASVKKNQHYKSKCYTHSLTIEENLIVYNRLIMKVYITFLFG